MTGLLLPSQVPPQYHCACGKKFYSVKAGQRHVARCEEAATIAERAARVREDDPLAGYSDPEARRWIDKRLSEGKTGTKKGRPA